MDQWTVLTEAGTQYSYRDKREIVIKKKLNKIYLTNNK